MVENIEHDTRSDLEDVLEQQPETQEISEQSFRKREAVEEVRSREYGQKGAETGVKRDLGFILDIPLEVSVEVGRTRMLVDKVLQLGRGSVIELDKLAGAPLEVLVNQSLIARGEVVVVNEKFGIRLTEIISPTKRVEKLGRPR